MQLCAGAQPEPSTKGGDSRGVGPVLSRGSAMHPSRGSGGSSGSTAPSSPHFCTSLHVCPEPTRVHQPCGPRLPETRTWALPTQGLASPHLTQLPSSSSTPSTSLPHGRGLVDTDKSRTDSFGRPEAFRVLAVAGRGGGGDRGSQPTSQTTGAQDGAWCPEPQGRPQVPSVAFEAPPRPQPCFKHQQVLSKAGATLQP